ncbi:hypothetical protein [Lactobacillus sp.]|uniref:hypothetical protein n=1 Tax=Lactobacillus sp. TaxID=1591 RepID=UPI001983D114|nr:hypothetical protein [Lactobacillus sp.]MBD5429322.1 hypothetical protein [Lactobacillus sp.]
MLTDKQYKAALFKRNRKLIEEYRGQDVYILTYDNQAHFRVLEGKNDFVNFVTKLCDKYIETKQLDKLTEILTYLFDQPEFSVEDSCKDYVLENYDVEYMGS